MSDGLIICCWFRADQLDWVRPTIRALRAYRHQLDFVKVDDDDRTTKPERILRMLDRHRGKILVVLDPHCIVHTSLDDLRYIEGDVSLYLHRKIRGRGVRYAVRGGTVVVRNNRAAKRFLRLWAALCKEPSTGLDQSPLARAVARVEGVVFHKLPINYVATQADQLGSCNVEFRCASDMPRKLGRLERFIWHATGW